MIGLLSYNLVAGTCPTNSAHYGDFVVPSIQTSLNWWDKKIASQKILVKFHRSRSLVFLVVLYVSLSIYFFAKLFQSLNLVSQFKNSKSLGLAEKNASLAVSQSLEFTIRHPYKSRA